MPPRTAPVHARVLTAVLLLALGSAGATSARAEIPAASLELPAGYPKDFALVKRAGLFHAFFIEAGPGGDANHLGHWSSPDLYHWTAHPPVLATGRNGWNRDQVWAPSIIERGGEATMFYTGVRRRADPLGCPGAPIQQVGAATSADLFDWSLAAEPWLEPNDVPWSLPAADSCDVPTFGAFRDPFLVQEPVSGDWLLYYVTVPDSTAASGFVQGGGGYDPNRMVVGLARAPAGFTGDADWSDLGALWCTHAAAQGGGGFDTWESPHVFRRSWQGQDLWFLFGSAGNGGVGGVHFMTGPSPTATLFKKKNRPGWTWRGSLANLGIRDRYGNQNVSAGWFATEYFRDPESGLEYFANCKFPRIEIRQLRWRAGDDGFDLEQPFRIVVVAADPAQAQSGQIVNLRFLARNFDDGGGPKVARIEALRLGAVGESLGVVSAESVGLPGQVPLTGDDTLLPWTVPHPPEGTLRLRIRLQAPATEIVSNEIVITGGGNGGSEGPPGLGGSGGFEFSIDADRGAAWVRASAPFAGRIEWFDLGGRRVRDLGQRAFPAGASEIHWDGRDNESRGVPAGIYFVRVSTAARSRSARLVVLPSGSPR